MSEAVPMTREELESKDMKSLAGCVTHGKLGPIVARLLATIAERDEILLAVREHHPFAPQQYSDTGASSLASIVLRVDAVLQRSPANGE